MTRTLTPAQADALVAQLDVDGSGMCPMCLAEVAWALEADDAPKVAGTLRRATLILWAEGLAAEALAAVVRARNAGVPHGLDALAELEARGGRSIVARAIVKRLAEELRARTRTELRVEALARDRLTRAPPELN